MIVVTIELWSAVTGKKTKLAEMHVSNDGTGTDKHGNYDGKVLRKPHFFPSTPTRTGRIERHDRHGLTVWHLLGKMLKNMGYVS